MRGLVTLVTFGTFMAEAIIHYNMGKSDSQGGFKMRMPPPKELAKIAAITGAFSLLSGSIVGALERKKPPTPPPAA
ncbi:MAG: hypothetical protein QNJ98_09565 [Planctomycetota bacterium]|nr:hypothetical protein [Planctomycetota bacterium]